MRRNIPIKVGGFEMHLLYSVTSSLIILRGLWPELTTQCKTVSYSKFFPQISAIPFLLIDPDKCAGYIHLLSKLIS
jgi:hypothetical protein